MAPSRPRTSWSSVAGDEIVPGRVTRSLLGGGERCEAYLVWNERLMTRTVLKVLRPGIVAEPRARRRLAREGTLLGRLQHPGLTRLFAMDAQGDRPFIEMEYVEGLRLSTLVRRHGEIDPEQAIPLGRQLAATLRYLHAEGILHLDVKPSNIVMGLIPRLIDLSVAKATEQARPINGFVGTDAYMSPEQADPALWPTIGPRSDTWGLGATLYRAVAGRLPYARGRREAAGVERFPQLLEAPMPLDPTRASPDLAETIMSALHRDPDARPSVTELLDRFDELAAMARVGRTRFR